MRSSQPRIATGYCGILLEWTLHWSLGKLMPDDLDTKTRENILYHARILGFFNSLCYASSLASSKISILSFYWRLFKTSTIRIPILVLLAMSVMWIIFRTFMLIFRCVPVQSIWDKTITACFPLLRPIFRHILPAQFLSSHGSSQPIIRPSNIIRLTTLSRTNKEAEADESSSTHQLADPEQGMPDGHDFDLAPARSSENVHTVISSREYGSERSSRDGDRGIYVRKDTLVEVEEIMDSKGRRYGSGGRS
ncbi:hypothetical protein B0J13DRAFT_599919 [Dactylonectria estremocensis]|uniref:Rhodopsin domain-containing protein n=1 Tax=Dactylonectria estremocensis TaxID=1079267 RepID=A0A9P9DD25_9HYPO|nr:hypothetical protein B0J13DRAFT_599919 [Dactylonectria estremocensis]